MTYETQRTVEQRSSLQGPYHIANCAIHTGGTRIFRAPRPSGGMLHVAQRMHHSQGFSLAAPNQSGVLGSSSSARFSSLLIVYAVRGCRYTKEASVSGSAALTDEPKVLVDTLTGRSRRERQCMTYDFEFDPALSMNDLHR